MQKDRLKPWTRRNFLKLAGAAAVSLGMNEARSEADLKKPVHDPALLSGKDARSPNTITLFLCGDVMTGRGIDQILPHPSSPEIYEPYMTSARGYVQLAEKANGPVPAPVDFSYIWGEALEEFEYTAPDVRIINLETAVTTSPRILARQGHQLPYAPQEHPLPYRGEDRLLRAGQ